MPPAVDKIPGFDPKAAEEQIHAAPVQAQILPQVTGEREEYLQEAGWTIARRDNDGKFWWNDPKAGGEPERRVGAELPISKKKGADTESVLQLHCPPTPWEYTTDDAVRLQRYRELAGESITDKLARKRRELEALEAKLVPADEDAA
jgi:hypothetical protein